MSKYNFTEALNQVTEQIETLTELKVIEFFKDVIGSLSYDPDNIYPINSIKTLLFGKVYDTITAYRKDLDETEEDEFDYIAITNISYVDSEQALAVISKMKKMILEEINQKERGEIIDYTGRKDEDGGIFDFAFVYVV